MESESFCRWNDPGAIAMVSALLPPIEIGVPVQVGEISAPKSELASMQIVVRGAGVAIDVRLGGTKVGDDRARTQPQRAVEGSIGVFLVVTKADDLSAPIPFELRAVMRPDRITRRRSPPAVRDRPA